MKKYIAIEINIPDPIMKAETEDFYIKNLMTKIRSINEHFIFTYPKQNFDSRSIAETFTGNWEFLDNLKGM